MFFLYNEECNGNISYGMQFASKDGYMHLHQAKGMNHFINSKSKCAVHLYASSSEQVIAAQTVTNVTMLHLLRFAGRLSQGNRQCGLHVPLGLHRLQKTFISHKNECCLFPCDNLPAKCSIHMATALYQLIVVDDLPRLQS